jgi:hypothetical protein
MKDLEKKSSWVRVGSKSNDKCPYKRKGGDTKVM